VKSNLITVTVDLGRIRRSAEDIRRRCGVPLLAVVKADAYGLGARQVAQALAEAVDGFVVFSLAEAVSAGLRAVANKPILALKPHQDAEPEEFISAGVRPAVWTVAEAKTLRSAKPVLSVDTGMRRFACPPENIQEVLAAGGCDEAFTHATTVNQALQLKRFLGDRGLKLHAAGSSLLDEPAARLDAVRPGIALYRGAVRASVRLLETHMGDQPSGYSGFVVPRFGVIPCGYFHGLRKGTCLIAGVPQQIIEVGMQSAYVQIDRGDSPGDEVVLLGDGLTEAQIAKDWGTTEQEVIARFARMADSI
jgi:alanine racemase